MKKWSLILIVILFFAADAAATQPWRINYHKGLELMSHGQYEEAVVYLKMALADKPVSHIYYHEPFEYLPYLKLGVCYYELGKPTLAKEYFELENSLKALSGSKDGKKLMQEYQSRLNARSQSQDELQAERVIRDYKKKAYLLQDTEVAKIKEEIRSRCNLPASDETAYPWYYHYELGLAMAKKSDWQRALDSFISALDHRDRPQKFTRIYGMWFIDYFPYFNIGLAHYHLQNWKCAMSSFRLSQVLEDMPSGSQTSLKLKQYQLETQQYLTEEETE